MKRVALLSILVCCLVCSSQDFQEYPNYPPPSSSHYAPFYSQGTWLPEWTQNYANPRWQRDTLTNDAVEIIGRLPKYGYPLRWSIFSDVNDTLQMAVRLRNQTGKPYLLTGKSVDDWFVPQVFKLEQDIYNDEPLLDETKLSFRCRVHKGNHDTLNYKALGNILIYDVWNLPKGTYRLVAKTTENIPKEFIGRTTGNVFGFEDAKDLADTTNAFEACYWRLKSDGNIEAAKEYIDKILQRNPTSIVGWAMKKDWCWKQDNIPCAIAALDSAIKYLKEELDPAAPTKKERENDPEAAGWYNHYLRTFKWERDFLDG